MSDALPKEARTLLEKASEMFDETGCVPGFDGEEVPAETIVPDAKEYILETIETRRCSTTPRYGMRQDSRWSFRGWHKNGFRNAASSHLAEIRTLFHI
jgi:hypothetical protein